MATDKVDHATLAGRASIANLWQFQEQATPEFTQFV